MTRRTPSTSTGAFRRHPPFFFRLGPPFSFRFDPPFSFRFGPPIFFRFGPSFSFRFGPPPVSRVAFSSLQVVPAVLSQRVPAVLCVRDEVHHNPGAHEVHSPDLPVSFSFCRFVYDTGNREGFVSVLLASFFLSQEVLNKFFPSWTLRRLLVTC